LIYQLKNAEAVTDRADAAMALGEIRNNPNVIVALGSAALHDAFWGVRVQALDALGKLGGSEAEKLVLAATADSKPWVREAAAADLARFAPDAAVVPQLTAMATRDPAYLVRSAALRALARTKSPEAFGVLASAANTDSPDNVVRRGALTAFGTLDDSRAVPLLLEWSSPGKPFACRVAAIAAIAGLDKSNAKITSALVSYLHEPYFDLQVATILALGRRGDPAAIAPLEALLHGGNFTDASDLHIHIALQLLQNPRAAE
ncbi:MAG: HEAT repeat domain-containing protein, partial [Acidobacteriota bacterium]|nr:HEAT repeat domain-containing protein [Acidobacteriota bacterium]